MRNHIAAKPVIATVIAATCFGSATGCYVAMTAAPAAASVSVSATTTPSPAVTATPAGNPWG